MTNTNVIKMNGIFSITLTITTLVLLFLVYPIRHRIDELCSRVEYIERIELTNLRRELTSLERDVAVIKYRIDSIENLLVKIDENVEVLRTRSE